MIYVYILIHHDDLEDLIWSISCWMKKLLSSIAFCFSLNNSLAWAISDSNFEFDSSNLLCSNKYINFHIFPRKEMDRDEWIRIYLCNSFIIVVRSSTNSFFFSFNSAWVCCNLSFKSLFSSSKSTITSSSSLISFSWIDRTVQIQSMMRIEYQHKYAWIVAYFRWRSSNCFLFFLRSAHIVVGFLYKIRKSSTNSTR